MMSATGGGDAAPIKTFKHSGDLGDIVYSLPTIRKLGGGVLLLDITGGADEPACRSQCIDKKTKFNQVGYEFIAPLLREQAYLQEVRVWNGEQVDCNLNAFRYKFTDPNARSKTRNLLDLHLDAFGLPPHDPDEGWLTCGEPVRLDRKIVVCRSPRMQSNFPWFVVRKFLFRDRAVFIGLPKEHELFEYTFDVAIPYHPTADALEMARVIAGCEMFVGNSTFALSLAIGLGTVSIVQEVEQHFPTTYFEGKKNMTYI
jgi:ADP-heptose:LPS heptosyltransferase